MKLFSSLITLSNSFRDNDSLLLLSLIVISLLPNLILSFFCFLCIFCNCLTTLS